MWIKVSSFFGCVWRAFARHTHPKNGYSSRTASYKNLGEMGARGLNPQGYRLILNNLPTGAALAGQIAL